MSSSFTNGRKAYIELDLEIDVKEIKDLIKMVKYLE